MNIIYTGQNGEFIEGIPSRTLTEEEWEALPDHLKAQALATGLYEPEEVKKAAPGSTTKKEA